MNTHPKTLAVLQPGYLPWLGFFDQMRQSDVFILYDDVQFDKNGWRNRNRIKSPNGPHWLSVPVHVSLGELILDVEIDNRQNWARKHLSTIQQFYAKAKYLDDYLPDLQRILTNSWKCLADLDVELIQQFRQWLGIDTEVVRSSQLKVAGDRNQRLLNFCLQFNATRYLSGAAAKCYLDVPMFESHGIEVVWQEYSHPIYPQVHGDFVAHLSVVDLLLNCGNSSGEILART